VALLKRKDSSAPVVTAVVPERTASTSGTKTTTPKKGHATPKRADAQAARRKPIVNSTVSSNTRPLTKEEKANQREKERASRDETYNGMKAGVEKHLPIRDKGPQRRYVRQYVDARRNLGEFLMPTMFLFLIVTFIIQAMGFLSTSAILAGLMWACLLAYGVDTYLMWRKLKVKLATKFGSVERGTAYYAAMRAFQIRRMRIPVATAKGNFPI